jgi:hypothetical protein
MKGQILMRELSTGDLFLFATKTKNLFLIDAKHVKEWKSSKQTSTVLQKMLKDKKVRKFTRAMLEQLQRAVKHIDFKI